MQYYSNSSAIGPRAAIADVLAVSVEQVELGHDGTGFYIISPEGANPDPAAVAAVAPPEPVQPPLTEFDQMFLTVQATLDQREFERTGKRVDPAGSVSQVRAWVATSMLYYQWGVPSDLTTPEVVTILDQLYADDSAKLSPESTDAAKKRAVQYVLVMREGAAFGEQYQAGFSSYERTASLGIRDSIQADDRDWMSLACGRWETVKAMFLALLK